MRRVAQQFPYLHRDPNNQNSFLVPFLPIDLVVGHERVSTNGLVDSGAAINVLPFSLGVQLGFEWDDEIVKLPLTGILGSNEARGIKLIAEIGPFAPVELAFAWTRSDETPVLLGQLNFFMEFDVCLFRSRAIFELSPKR